MTGKTINVHVGTDLTINVNSVPKEVVAQITEALTIPNPEWAVAQREQPHGWEDMPEFLSLYEIDVVKRVLHMPRGFAVTLKKGLRANGYTIQYIDFRTVNGGMHKDWHELSSPRAGQLEAVKQILQHEQGILEATPGWGKTVTMLEAIRQSGQQALVIADKTNIMNQWRLRAEEHFGAKATFVGGGEFEVSDLTIATVQTLWSKREELKEDGFFDQFGLVCLDECHHASATTYAHVLSMFPAKYRIGLSATPDKFDGTDAMIVTTIGEVIYRPGKEKLREAGQLVKPKVKKVPTQFDFPFRPTRRINGKLIRNNYTEMMGDLVEDVDRNVLIARHLEHGKANLVVSDRLAQLDEIARFAETIAGFRPDQIMFLTGREDMKEREKVAELAEAGDCVLLSTIAKEAVDIPRLDRLHMAWPVRKTHILKQTIGRIERGHAEKGDAVVYDYFDPKVSVLRGQSQDRSAFYREEKLVVETLAPGV